MMLERRIGEELGSVDARFRLLVAIEKAGMVDSEC